MELGSRRRGSCSPCLIGSISDPMFRSSLWPSVGWVTGCILSIFEVREDEVGEILHLVTLWRSTKEEIRLYENS